MPDPITHGGKTVRRMNPILCSLVAAGIAAPARIAQQQPAPGIPSIQIPFTTLKPAAAFKVGGTADWVQVTDNAVWVAAADPFSVQRIDPIQNKIVATIPVRGEVCSGQVSGFGSLWVPVCGKRPSVVRIDERTNRIAAEIPIPFASAEGGIAAGGDSVWMVTDKPGTTLSRINPATNRITQKITVPAGSFNPVFSDGIVWVTCTKSSVLTAIDARSGKQLASIHVGPGPRFLTAGAGSVWTLNQGDGSVTRIDVTSRKVTANIPLGLPGHGGDIDYGADSVWVTMMNVPLTRIDTKSNRAIRQWAGKGGDSLRFGFDSVWLTDYHKGTIVRIPYLQVAQP